MNPSLQRYTGVAITLHWLIAAVILGTFLLGQYMTGLELSPAKLKLYSYHKSCADPHCLAHFASPACAAGIDAGVAA